MYEAFFKSGFLREKLKSLFLLPGLITVAVAYMANLSLLPAFVSAVIAGKDSFFL